MPFHIGSDPTAPSASTERMVALVIGNSGYLHSSELANPVNDAEAIAGVLARLGFDVVKGLNLDLRKMGDVQEAFEAKLRSKPDIALLYYAGHGLQVKGLNYLVPIDAQIEAQAHLSTRAVRFNDIFDPMAEEAGASLIFLDACRDNPFTRNLARSLGEGARSASIRGGLARIEKVAGTFIAYATAPDTVAFDGKGKNSPFTAALLKHIETPGLSVADMMIDVRNSVLAETGNRQEPWDQSSLRARFSFVPKIEEAKTEVAVKPLQLSAASDEWAAIQHTTSLAVLARFKEHHPKPPWCDYADARANELREADEARRKALEAERPKTIEEPTASQATSALTSERPISPKPSALNEEASAPKAKAVEPHTGTTAKRNTGAESQIVAAESALQRSAGGPWRRKGVRWAVVAMVAGVMAVAGYFSIPASTRGYWTAQSRIAEAARSGSKTLDLTGLRVEQLPPELFNLSQLTSLDLTRNKLTALPPDIGKLTQLTSLDLDYNELTTLPPDIGNLTQLTFLDLEDNNLTPLPPDIGKLTQLTSLDLNYNKLTALPPELFNLTQLTSLDLSLNNLTTLPPDIGKLTQLTSLDLGSNKLTALPPDIGKLTQLTFLDLGNSNLTALPPELFNLTQLTSLDLWGNELTALPPDIGNLTQLTNLSLGYNKLTALPPDIGKLTQLISLSVVGNPWKQPFDALVEKGPRAVTDYLAKQVNRKVETQEPAKPQAEFETQAVPLPKGFEGTPFEEFFGEFFGKSGADSAPPILTYRTLTDEPLGLTISILTDELRTKYRIKKKVKGVVVTVVDPDGAAATKNIKEGDVITEVSQDPVSKPTEITKRIDEDRRSGRRSVLLLVTDPSGEMRFVALPLK